MGKQVAARILSKGKPLKWGCSSVGRAPALQAGGHEFESHHLHLPGNKTVFWLHKHHCAKCFAEVAQQLLMHGVYLHGILLHEHHCAKCCIMREPLLELIWYLENFIQRLIRYLLSRHPRKTETRTRVQAFFKKRRPRILTL